MVDAPGARRNAGSPIFFGHRHWRIAEVKSRRSVRWGWCAGQLHEEPRDSTQGLTLVISVRHLKGQRSGSPSMRAVLVAVVVGISGHRGGECLVRQREDGRSWLRSEYHLSRLWLEDRHPGAVSVSTATSSPGSPSASPPVRSAGTPPSPARRQVPETTRYVVRASRGAGIPITDFSAVARTPARAWRRGRMTCGSR
jgi:hypothetical protein